MAEPTTTTAPLGASRGSAVRRSWRSSDGVVLLWKSPMNFPRSSTPRRSRGSGRGIAPRRPLEEARGSRRAVRAPTPRGYPSTMPGAKPKVKGKKRKSIGGTPDDERAPAPSTAAAKGKGKSKKAMEDGDGGSEPVDDRFAKLPSFDVELDSDLDEDPVDEDDDFDEATWLDHEDDGATTTTTTGMRTRTRSARTGSRPRMRSRLRTIRTLTSTATATAPAPAARWTPRNPSSSSSATTTQLAPGAEGAQQEGAEEGARGPGQAGGRVLGSIHPS